jgi:hypothetical protein
MKKIIGSGIAPTKIAAACGALITAGGFATAAPASATASDFVRDVSALGVYDVLGPSHMVDTGVWLCNHLIQGYSVDAVATQFYNDSHAGQGSSGLQYQTARSEVMFAQIDLCPGTIRLPNSRA